MEKHFDTIEEALSKAREVKKFLSSLDYKNHLILKEYGYCEYYVFAKYHEQLKY